MVYSKLISPSQLHSWEKDTHRIEALFTRFVILEDHLEQSGFLADE
jgi:hypothetical protein